MNSGKKQKWICGKSPAERTAVRAAPMVCSGESPQRARRRSPLPPAGNDAPTTARNGSCRPMGFSPASVPEGFQRASGKPFGASAGAYPLPRRGMTRRLWRRLGLAVLWVSRQLRCPKVSKGRAESPLVRPQAHTPFPDEGMARQLWRRLGLAVLWVSRQLRCLKVPKGRAESPLVRPQAHTPAPGGD